MNINITGSINSGYDGYSKLIDSLCSIIKSNDNEKLIFDFSRLNWMDANLLAVIGAIFEETKNKNRIHYVKNSIADNFEKLWARNGFGGYFNLQKKYDINGTVVEYKVIDGNNINHFSDYIYNDLLAKTNLPVMSDNLKKEIRKNLLEIFGNAPMHGGCKNVISCGQIFPKRNELCFTIANSGTTIMDNVQEYFTCIMHKPAPPNTIKWATGEYNSTKILVNGKSGGLGLSILKEFIAKNKGKIQICSGNEYWEFNSGEESTNTFRGNFPGTIVTVIINLNDTSSYCLQTELLNDKIIF